MKRVAGFAAALLIIAASATVAEIFRGITERDRFSQVVKKIAEFQEEGDLSMEPRLALTPEAEGWKLSADIGRDGYLSIFSVTVPVDGVTRVESVVVDEPVSKRWSVIGDFEGPKGREVLFALFTAESGKFLPEDMRVIGGVKYGASFIVFANR